MKLKNILFRKVDTLSCCKSEAKSAWEILQSPEEFLYQTSVEYFSRKKGLSLSTSLAAYQAELNSGFCSMMKRLGVLLLSWIRC